MTPKAWKTLSSRPIYENPWTLVREDIAEMPNGKTTVYGVVECGHCVGVLPFIDNRHVVLVRQYRYVFGEGDRWEMPTGGVNSGEALIEAAHRELREEVGYEAAELEEISTYYRRSRISILDGDSRRYRPSRMKPNSWRSKRSHLSACSRWC